MVKRSRVRFCVSCNYSWTVHFFVKILLKLKILSISACLNLNYGTAKQYLVGRGFLTAYLIKTPPLFTAYLLFSFFFFVFYATSCQVNCDLTQMAWFLLRVWFDITHSTHNYQYILKLLVIMLTAVICITLSKSLIDIKHLIKEVHSIFAFQKLFPSRSPITAD